MCKHKSGGMSKPSTGASSQQDGGHSDRSTPASLSSHDCPQSTTPSSMTPTTDPSAASPSSSEAAAPLYGVPPAHTRKYLSAHPCDKSYGFLSPKSEMPNVQEENQFLESDDDTEQSPMLVKDSLYSWDPNVMPKDIPGERPNHFNPCDPYYCSKMDRRNKFANNCDNFQPLYHNFRPPPQPVMPMPYQVVAPQYHGATASGGACPSYYESTINNFDEQVGGGYAAMVHKKKWMLNQKCKSADSEPDSFSGHLSSVCKQGISPVNYNYVQGQSTNVLETTHQQHNPYFKPMYMSNGDPIAGPSGLQRPSSINWEIGANNPDSEFRSRSYSLTPTVNFAVFELESSSEAEDVQEPMVPEVMETPPSIEVNTKTMDDPFELPMMSLGKVIPISPSAAQLSIASSYGDNGSPICKICHMTARESDPLISPCRCSGTMQYIHCGCLMRWLEVCHKRGRRPASCELCQYQYHWHKKFKIRHWQFPPCSRKDKILHLLFIFSVLLMITCASLTIMFFKQDKGTKVELNQELTQSEIGNLVCGVLFFVAFFVSIYVEAKSHDTLYKLLVKFIHINQQWYIDEYEKKETAPVAV